MDFLKRMNEAIEYIEENLCNDFSEKYLANIMGCSYFHLVRTFGFITDISLFGICKTP